MTGAGVPAGSTAEPVAQAHRVIFIDLARAIAVVLMIVGHTLSALLAPAYTVGRWYDAWQFQRGLTSSLFLLLSGFAFSIATTRHWNSHTTVSPVVLRRVRRFVFFILLGYSLHVPLLPITRLMEADASQWRTFLQIDVLQLIGVTFIVIQGLVLACRTRVAFMVVSFVLAVLLVVITPPVWNTDWTAYAPIGVAAYLSQGTGSIFPLVPFAASVLIGTGLGQLYARWGASHLSAFANQVLLASGVVLTVFALIPRTANFTPYAPGPGMYIPVEFILRTGVSLIVLALVAHASRRITRLPRVFGAVAQESLLIYYAHLCIVYGSIWSPGLVQTLGVTLRPAQAVPLGLAIVAAMVLLAWPWNWIKHVRPRAARAIRAAVAALVIYRLA